MKTVPLADLAAINPRSASVGADELVDFVGMAELNPISAIAEPRETVPFEVVAKGYTGFRDRDILLAKITPCWENGKVGQAQLSRPHGVGSTEFHVVRSGADVDSRYLMHFLRSPGVRATGELRMTGSGGQRRVPVKFLQDLRVPVLELEEQRRIAAILDHADALRAKRRQVLAHFDDLTQSIFRDMFETAPTDSLTLSDVAAVSSGITKGRRAKEATRAVPYLAVANVQAGALKLDSVKTIDATDSEIARYALAEGDLVLTEGGDPDKLGRGTVWRSEIDLCLHQNHVFRVRPNARVVPEYLTAWLAAPVARSHFRRSAKQTTGIASINMTQLKATPVLVPPLPLQERYAAIVAHARAVTGRMAGLAERDDELFASLQSRAFSGEL